MTKQKKRAVQYVTLRMCNMADDLLNAERYFHQVAILDQLYRMDRERREILRNR
jgi:hypothetical protein